jgi:hypothetical protein
MSFRSAACPALSVVLAATTALAQPARRAHHALVYDASTERVLLTGGSSPSADGQCCAFFGDVWAFDGTRWSLLDSTGTPLSGVALAFDARAKRVVSFGGYRGQSLGIVRSLKGGTWTTTGGDAPIAAAEPGFVYDMRGDRFIAFGGSAGRGQAHGDTWTFDGSTWSTLAVAGPPPRQAHAMAYDERRGRVVVFGGGGPSGPGSPPTRLGDLWEFDGSAWTQRTGSGPVARMSAGVAYDSKRGRMIFFGGMGPDGFLGDTWSWDGVEWQKLSDTGPEPRAMGYLAYDRKRDRVVLFGGRKGWPNDLNDTWEFDGTTWRQVAPGGG